MRLRLLRAAGALTFLALSLCPLTALAHEEITVGNYVIEYGWQEEPPVAGQPNAIVLAIGGAEGEPSDEGLSGQIHLVAPADGSTLSGDTLEVTIRVEGIDEHDAESLHWDLTVDEREVAMAPLTQTTLTLTGLSNGSHTIEAALAGSDHGDLGEPARAAITVEGSTASGDPSAAGVEPVESHAENVDVSGFTAALVYGGETHPLRLEPLPDGEPGQFKADFTPVRPGQYTLKLGGTLAGELGETGVDVAVEPEEVMPGPTPAPTPSALGSAMPLILIGGLVTVVAAFSAWFFVVRKRK